jgi:hypothetical protein
LQGAVVRGVTGVLDRAHDFSSVEICVTQHPNDACEWALSHVDIVHHGAEQVFTGHADGALLFETTGRECHFQLVAIIRASVFTCTTMADVVFSLAHSMYLHGPHDRATVVGQAKRGDSRMTSVGFNCIARNSNRVATYWSGVVDARVEHLLWATANAFSSLVAKEASQTMGSVPVDTMARLVSEHYTQPLVKVGLHQLAQQPPVLRGVPCHSIQQTCNGAVLPHFDKGDLNFSMIVWAVRGQVSGPFVLHHLGYHVPIENGTAVLLRTKDVLHGTPPPNVEHDGVRVGSAFVLNTRLMTIARKTAIETRCAPWMEAPQTRMQQTMARTL